MSHPKNMSELADIVEKAIREQNDIGPGNDAAIRRVAVAVARHGSRYAHYAEFTDSAVRVGEIPVRYARRAIAHRASRDLAGFGLIVSPIVAALISHAARWFIEWLLKRLENRDAVAAIAAGEAAWTPTESPQEFGE
jgi:hypothetical protein